MGRSHKEETERKEKPESRCRRGNKKEEKTEKRTLLKEGKVTQVPLGLEWRRHAQREIDHFKESPSP